MTKSTLILLLLLFQSNAMLESLSSAIWGLVTLVRRNLLHEPTWLEPCPVPYCIYILQFCFVAQDTRCMSLHTCLYEHLRASAECLDIFGFLVHWANS